MKAGIAALVVALTFVAAVVAAGSSSTRIPAKEIGRLRAHVNGMAAQKCRSAWPMRFAQAGAIPVAWRPWVFRQWRRRHAQIHRLGSACSSSPSGGGWTRGFATWYGPGFYGSSPACGGAGLSESSWWVATVPARCGATVTICASRCVTAPAMDTGAFPSSNLDLTPAVARALGGLYTRPVRWRFG